MTSKVFIGRSTELEQVKTQMKNLSEQGTGGLVLVYGEGGIGKSDFVAQINKVANEMDSIIPLPVINLGETQFQDHLHIIDFMASEIIKLDQQSLKLPDYSASREKYYQADSNLKPNLREQCISSFLSDLQNVIQNIKVLFTLDTFEAVKSKSIFDWIINTFIPNVSQNSLVMIAGRDNLSIDSSIVDHLTECKLSRFVEDEIMSLAREMYEQRGEYFELRDDFINILYEKTQGKPIIASIAIDWILETGELQEVLQIPKTSFEREIATRFLHNPTQPQENEIIRILYILGRGITNEILEIVYPHTDQSHEQILENIRRFSFIKFLSHSNKYLLHDEMFSLINKFGKVEQEDIANTRSVVVDKFYQPKIKTSINSAQHQNDFIDMLFYQLSYSQENGYKSFNEEYTKAFNEYEFRYCNRLLTIVKAHNWNEIKKSWISVLEGELLLQENKPLIATSIFSKISANDTVIHDDELMLRVFENLGRCAILGCDIAGDDVNKSLGHLNKAMNIAKKTNDLGQISSIRFHTGQAQEMLGNHDIAIAEYHKAIIEAENIGDENLVGNITDSLVLLYRRIGQVDEALKWAQKGLSARSSLQDPRVLAYSYHNLGTVNRDLRNQDDAISNLTQAIDLYIETKNYLNAAQALKDLGWTYFVFKDQKKAREFAEKSLELCDKYGFGRIKGEALHTIFEVVDAEHGEDKSQEILDEATELCRNHSGLFMLMDLLMHQVIIDRRTKNDSAIEARIDEMEDLKKRGCKYHYFLGRAYAVWGDSALDSGDLKLAVERYKRAYYELALGGESAAFQASYPKHIKNHFPTIVTRLSELDLSSFISYWEATPFKDTHSEVLNILNEELKKRNST